MLQSVVNSIDFEKVSLLAVLLGVIGYLWRQNAELRAKRQSEMVDRIEHSINQLTQTIEKASQKYDETTHEMWTYIGSLDKKLSNLIGQHEVNHKVKVDE